MKRKKAIKLKKEAIHNVQCEIIDTLSELVKMASNPKEQENPLDMAFKSLGYMARISALRMQKQMIIQQPIKPNKKNIGTILKPNIPTLSNKDFTLSIENRIRTITLNTPLKVGEYVNIRLGVDTVAKNKPIAYTECDCCREAIKLNDKYCKYCGRINR